MQGARTILVAALLMSTAPAGLAGAEGPGACDRVEEASTETNAGCTGEAGETRQAPTSLREALQAHPRAEDRDLLALQAHQPLPGELDAALGQLVDAHRRAHEEGTPAPLLEQVPATGAELTAGAETLADQQQALASAPERPAADPVTAEEAGPLTASLVDLYTALGLGEAILQDLEPRIEASLTPLDGPDRTALAQLVTAQARYQAAALDAVRVLAGHEVPDREVLADALAAQADLEATLATLADGWAQREAAGHEDPWSDPLGLVVLGTPGPDRFDATIDGDEQVAEPVAAQERQTREVLEGSVSLSPVPEDATPEAHAEGSLASETEARTGSGWHLLVLDPGGDDTYADNAGGIDAGTTLEVHAGASGPIETVREPLVDDGHVCLPDTGACEPFGAAGFLQALGHLGARADASSGLAMPLSATVLDAAGDDTYLDDGGPVIQGAARGPATGLLLDVSGDDTYEATHLAQGAASLYGHGALVDRAGDDTYTAGERAQAWAELPSAGLVPTELGPFEGEDLTVFAAQHARGLLHDRDGEDAYRLADLRTGQGVTQLDGDFAHHLRRWVPAELLDTGGPEQLPVPTRPTTFGSEPVEPTRLELADQRVLQTWIKRPLHAEDPSPPPDEELRYKTALGLDRSRPEVLSSDGLHVGDGTAECNAEPGSVLAGVCHLVGSLSTPGVLVGSPDEMEDPPPLTIGLTGDTVWRGDIATSEGSPSLHVDVLGDDRYEAGDRSIAYAAAGGTALLVDVRGQDTVTAGDRTLAHAVDAESTAIAWDVDGRLNATTGAQSQAFARQLSSTPYAQILDTHNPSDAPERPALSLLELGHGDEDEGPARLEAGNRSQAYSRGLGTALLNGTHGDDAYRAHGWGQGVHEDQQILQRFCEGLVPDNSPFGVVDGLTRGTTPWIGGTGALLEPGGDDSYTIDGDAGQGDAATIAPAACGSRLSNLLRGPAHVSPYGLGLLHDDAGADTYEQTQQPPRPAKLPDRACGGANETPCRPADDRVWTAIDEEQITDVTAVATYGLPATVGLGIDGTENVANATMAVCRGYEPVYDRDPFGGLIHELLPSPADAAFMGDCDRTLRETTALLPTGADAATLFATAVPHDDRPLPFDDTHLRGDAP